MASKYVDNTAITQVIGSVFNTPSLLEESDTYYITEQDFPEEFHRIVFGVLYKLYESGTHDFTLEVINDYLESKPSRKAVYDVNKGNEYLQRAAGISSANTFNYYYNRLKKMSLLRAYDNVGIDVSFLYDPDEIFDMKKKELQEEWLDHTTLEDIAVAVDDKISKIRETYVDVSEFGEAYLAGDGIEDLIRKFEEVPDAGVPLYGNYINTITRGARLGKFYLRSAPTGIGKTRSMIADACYIACEKIWDDDWGWIAAGGKNAQPVLFIGTEQDKDEIQTMMLAFVSGVNEEHILNGRYDKGERERVFQAATYIKDAPLFIEELPEFNLQDVENTIKRNIREHNTTYCFFDYIHTSLTILEEISRKAGKIALREDNILFMLSARLKEICVKYNIFIMSATQLNGTYTDSTTPDQNLLRGAKAIADKIDYGSILLPVRDTDLAALEPVLTTHNFSTPTIKLSIYKNRRGRYKGVILWCKADLGTCRIQPMFLTDYLYELQGIEDIKIIVEQESAF